MTAVPRLKAVWSSLAAQWIASLGLRLGLLAIATLLAVYGLLAGADFFVPVTAPWPPSDASLSSWLRRVRAAADRR